jgi:Tol biopolymer transport system component
LGGTPQKLVTDIDSNITFSPDGREFAYTVYNNPESGKYRVVAQAVDSSNSRVLTTGPADARFDDPAWSPDGKTIVGVTIAPGDALSGLMALDVHGGQKRMLVSSPTGFFNAPTWLPDGTGLLVLVAENSNVNQRQIAIISYPDGKSRPVTRDTNSYSALGLAADGRTLVTVLNERHAGVSVLPAASAATQGQEVASSARVFSSNWTPDGKLIVDQDLVLSLLNPATGEKTALATASGLLATTPSPCANGRYIVFAGTTIQSGTNIWRMDAAGGNLKQLTSSKLEQTPICSPDGHWVIYDDLSNGNKLSKVPLEGGPSQRVSEEFMVPGFDLSPDGKLVALASFHHVDAHKEMLVLIDANSGQELKALDFERPRQGVIRFARDGKAVAYPVLTGAADNLWLQPLDGSPGKQITDFKSEQIVDFHWSSDGSALAVTRSHIDSDVVLIRDMQP